MKKILLIDKSEKTNQIVKILIEKYSSFSIDLSTDTEKIIHNYKDDEYEYIIFDHSFEDTDKIIEYILTNFPKQKAILLSDSLLCPIECASCLDTFKFVRLLKPVDPKTLLNYINSNDKDFSCPNKHKFENINTIELLYDFINLENNIQYKSKKIQENNIYVINSKSDNISRLNEVEKIRNLVNGNYFKFELVDNFDIKISMKG